MISPQATLPPGSPGPSLWVLTLWTSSCRWVRPAWWTAVPACGTLLCLWALRRAAAEPWKCGLATKELRCSSQLIWVNANSPGGYCWPCQAGQARSQAAGLLGAPSWPVAEREGDDGSHRISQSVNVSSPNVGFGHTMYYHPTGVFLLRSTHTPSKRKGGEEPVHGLGKNKGKGCCTNSSPFHRVFTADSTPWHQCFRSN